MLELDNVFMRKVTSKLAPTLVAKSLAMYPLLSASNVAVLKIYKQASRFICMYLTVCKKRERERGRDRERGVRKKETYLFRTPSNNPFSCLIFVEVPFVDVKLQILYTTIKALRYHMTAKYTITLKIQL